MLSNLQLIVIFGGLVTTAFSLAVNKDLGKITASVYVLSLIYVLGLY